MSIRTVLVPIPVAEPKDAVMVSAVQVAKKAGAHVVGLAVEDGGQGGDRAAAAAANAPTPHQAQALLRAAEERSESASERRDAVRARFEALCTDHGIRFLEDEAASDEASGPSASWSHTHDDVEGIVRGRGSDFDLTVAGGTAVGRFENEVARGVLRSNGCAVLLSAVRWDGEVGNKIVIAWNASPQSWSAVSAAMPFLQRASRVTVVTVAGGGLDREAAAERQAELVRHLADHDVEATAKIVELGVRKLHDAILTEVSELGGDLLVMGASARHPLRQKLFGSVAAKVLGRVAATPVFMAH